jgi:hypothetical protein
MPPVPGSATKETAAVFGAPVSVPAREVDPNAPRSAMA